MLNIKNNRKVYIFLAAIFIIALVIAGRIYFQLSADKERAERASQGRLVAVETAAAERRDLETTIVFSANLEPCWTADLSSKVDGRIDKLYVDEGDAVKAGSVIAVLDADELLYQVAQAEGSLYSAQANLEQAELDYTRAQALVGEGAISLQAADTARIKRDLASGQVRTAISALSQLKVRLGNINVIAPRSGVVTKKYVQAGAYARTAAPLVNLADVTALIAKASVGEAQISQINVGQMAVITIEALGGAEFSGSVSRVTPVASLPSRTFTAEVTINNPGGVIKAGMFAKVELAGGVRRNALAVPESALVLREDQKSVFVVGADNKVIQRILKIGYVGGGWAEVLDGLTEGEIIVVAGQNKLRDGSVIDASKPKGE